MSDSARLQLPISYYTEAGECLYGDEETGRVPEIGSGIILSAPGHSHEARWRVVDVWHSFAQQSPFNWGAHVFLRAVSDTEEDLPQRIDPDYYTPIAGD
ncbi:hypothetical protein [Calidifontibacter indicus]|uniref:Uncharacterized protein n=1 Tax=Calidifontibacter indicus TaxID=419650 RepID=A0A3D9UQ98_9MICO|nr:hypothetical protein [Calidifontibacter indicus]REF30643.1 hypothetical protein DFJ65_1658 [Calidifontibacter indicus]